MAYPTKQGFDTRRSIAPYSFLKYLKPQMQLRYSKSHQSEERSASSRFSRRGGLPAFVLLACGLLAGQALAQGTNAPATQNGTKCQAGQGQSNKTGRADQRPVQDGQSLSGSLADCNGVLAPPAIGDKGLVEPAPQTGNMPVIKPGQVQPKVSGD